MKSLIPELPNSSDEYWDGDKNTIDLEKVKNELCQSHKLVLKRGSREANCSDCGFGFRFIPSEIELKGDKVFTTNGKLLGESLTIVD